MLSRGKDKGAKAPKDKGKKEKEKKEKGDKAKGKDNKKAVTRENPKKGKSATTGAIGGGGGGAKGLAKWESALTPEERQALTHASATGGGGARHAGGFHSGPVDLAPRPGGVGSLALSSAGSMSSVNTATGTNALALKLQLAAASPGSPSARKSYTSGTSSSSTVTANTTSTSSSSSPLSSGEYPSWSPRSSPRGGTSSSSAGGGGSGSASGSSSPSTARRSSGHASPSKGSPALPKDRKQAQLAAMSSFVNNGYSTSPIEPPARRRRPLFADGEEDGDDLDAPAAVDDEALIEVADGRPTLRAGTFMAIVKWIIFEGAKDAVSSFLITFRAYGTPAELWEAMMAVFDIADTSPKLNDAKRKQLRKRVLTMLVEWIQRFSYKDFEEGKDRSLFQKLAAFIKTLPNEEANQFKLLFMRAKTSAPKKPKNPLIHRGTPGSAPALLTAHGAVLPRPTSSPTMTQEPLSPLAKSEPIESPHTHRRSSTSSDEMLAIPEVSSSSGSSPLGSSSSLPGGSDILSLLLRERRAESIPAAPPAPTFVMRDMGRLRKLSSKDIARQMTAMDAVTFSEIKPEEMLRQNWTRDNKEELAPTLTKLSTIFNKWSYWVSTEILLSSSTTEQANTTRKFIRVLHNLYKFNNFHSLMAVLSGLNRAAISRLTHVWERIPPKYMELLKWMEEVMNPRGNFKYYRQLLAEYRSKRPIIPYLIVFLRDLTFINDGNLETLPSHPKKKNGKTRQLPNFEKMTLLGKQILELEAYRAVPFGFRPDPELSDLLDNVIFLDEEALHQKSLELCPATGGLSLVMRAEATTSDEPLMVHKNPLLALQDLKLDPIADGDPESTESDDTLTS